jgi:protein-disulfide isomerase
MFVLSLGAVIIGLVAVAALVFATGGFSDEAAAVSLPDVDAPAEELRQGRTLVAAGAEPTVVVEAFEDPKCPACAAFTERIEPLLIAEHVRSGTASFTYRDFPVIDEQSYRASAAMRAADELDGRFWDLHAVVYHNQDGGFSDERLAEMAELVGLDGDAFLEALDDPGLRAAVEAERQLGLEMGVNSTPAILVNGVRVGQGVPTWDELDAAIVAAAGDAEATGDAATEGDADGTLESATQEEASGAPETTPEPADGESDG